MWENLYAKEYLGQYYLHSENLPKQLKDLWQSPYPIAIPASSLENSIPIVLWLQILSQDCSKPVLVLPFLLVSD